MKILIVKNEAPDFLRNEAPILKSIKDRLRDAGFDDLPAGELRRGHVTVVMTGLFESAKSFIEKSRPRVLITDWHLDQYHRHTSPPKGDGGVFLAQHALNHGCENVLCIPTPETRGMPDRVLELLGRDGNDARTMAVFKTLIGTLPRDPVMIARHILGIPREATRPVYGPRAPVADIALKRA